MIDKEKQNISYVENDELIISNETYERIINSPIYEYNLKSGSKSYIPMRLFYQFVCDEAFHDYFIQMRKKGKTLLMVKCLEKKVNYRLSFSEIIKCIEDTILDDYDAQKLNDLIDICSVESLINDYKQREHYIDVDGEKISISCSALLQVFLSDEKGFEENFKEDKISGIDRRTFAYLLDSFIEENNLFDKYIFPQFVHERYKRLKGHEIVDYQSINIFDREESYKEYEISQDLKEYILSNMNPSYSLLEKSIYIYIKLCRSFSYDPHFYVIERGSGTNLDTHLDKKRLENIKINEDEIVCYEFNVMFAKLLEELNIRYQINSISSNIYGGGHVSLTYIVNQYIIGADAVTSVLGGDLVNAKINTRLKGLICKNKSPTTRQNFDKILSRVYKDISEENPGEYEIKSLVSLYQKLNAKENKPLTGKFKKKVEILLEEIGESKLQGVDAIGYLLKLGKTLFEDKELANYVNFCVVKVKKDDEYTGGVIVTVNEKNYIEQVDKNKYFCYIPGERVNCLKKDALSKLMISGKIKYIESTTHEIPGFYRGVWKGR